MSMLLQNASEYRAAPLPITLDLQAAPGLVTLVTHPRAQTHTNSHTHTHTHIHIHIHMHIHTYTHTDLHTHTHNHPDRMSCLKFPLIFHLL